ncbi:MAG: ornithine carbamoyltransferase [Candidatus Micrarchaeota archaeon]|nr:ornithine carbamoyltransferase [Candidatus Micrarchaeota archaeon]
MNLISSDDLTKADIKRLFTIGSKLSSQRSELSLRSNTTVALLFTEPSTRTRVSFEVAVAQLGGMPIYIDAKTTQLSRGEQVGDTAKMLSMYCDFIAIRTYDHETVVQMGENSTIPVINALTSLEHPTQALADIYTIYQKKGDLKGLKIAFIGDIAQNTCNSLMLSAAKLGAEFSLVGPKGWRPKSQYYNKAREYGRVYVSESIEDGLEDADVVYTDTFVSMGFEGEAEERRKLFLPYQLNQKAMSYAKRDAIAMHPLPAHRGEEIASDVLDGKQSAAWDQAKNKLVMEKAILLYLSEVEENK